MVFIVSGSVIGACRRYRQQQHCLTYSTAGVINLATGAIAFFVAERLSYPVSAHHWAPDRGQYCAQRWARPAAWRGVRHGYRMDLLFLHPRLLGDGVAEEE